MTSPQDGERWCPTCSGKGIESFPIEDDWGGIEGWVEKECGICGGTGIVDAENFAEMEAEYGPSYTW